MRTWATVAPAFEPSKFFIKVGEEGGYEQHGTMDWTMPLDWAGVKGLTKEQLLRRLKLCTPLRRALLDVQLSRCSVTILKGELRAGKYAPVAADEADDAVVQFTGSATLHDVTAKGGCTGKQLFIRVRLPAHAARTPTPGAAAAGEDCAA